MGAGAVSEEAALDPIKTLRPPAARSGEPDPARARPGRGPMRGVTTSRCGGWRAMRRFAPSQLLRERALLELAGFTGSELQVPYAFRRVEESRHGSGSGFGALNVLVDATRGLLEERASAEARGAFDEAIALLAGVEHDVQGGTRILRAIGPFLRGSGPRGAERAAGGAVAGRPAAGASAKRSRRGSSTRHRWRAPRPCEPGSRLSGSPSSSSARSRWSPPRSRRTTCVRFSTFEVPNVPADFVEVYLAVGDALVSGGMPAAAEGPSVEGVQLKTGALVGLHFVAVNDLLFPRSRNAAMRALGALSDGELMTYREEEWDNGSRSARINSGQT